MIGGIDLGGTKIEARLFDDDLNELSRQRIDTPKDNYKDMLSALTQIATWLDQHSPGLPIGLALPGLINPTSGVMLAANLPCSGQALASDLAKQFARPIPLINDSRAFTLSEAMMGAGQNFANVIGLIIGSGVAGGQAQKGQAMLLGQNGQYGEFGHTPLPAHFIAQYDLPLLPCGCGQIGCMETYLSGSGLMNLAKLKMGRDATSHEIVANPKFTVIMDIWHDLLRELIGQICKYYDPDIIILGGGLGMLDGLPDRLLSGLSDKLLNNTTPPIITQAEGGDASGARGAALFALSQDRNQSHTKPQSQAQNWPHNQKRSNP